MHVSDEFVILIVVFGLGVPLLIAIGLPVLAYRWRQTRPLATVVIIAIQSSAVAISLAASGREPVFLGFAVGALLSTVASLVLTRSALHRAVLPVAAGVMVLGGIAAGIVAAVRASREAEERARYEQQSVDDDLVAQIEEQNSRACKACLERLRASTMPRADLDGGWQSSFGDDSSALRWNGTHAGRSYEVELRCSSGMDPEVTLTVDCRAGGCALDGGFGQLEARDLRELASLMPDAGLIEAATRSILAAETNFQTGEGRASVDWTVLEPEDDGTDAGERLRVQVSLAAP